MGYMRVIWRWLTGKKVLQAHCWASPTIPLWSDNWWQRRKWKEYEQHQGSTCMLLDGHLGLHRWTPDTHILITFPTVEALIKDLKKP